MLSMILIIFAIIALLGTAGFIFRRMVITGGSPKHAVWGFAAAVLLFYGSVAVNSPSSHVPVGAVAKETARYANTLAAPSSRAAAKLTTAVAAVVVTARDGESPRITAVNSPSGFYNYSVRVDPYTSAACLSYSVVRGAWRAYSGSC